MSHPAAPIRLVVLEDHALVLDAIIARLRTHYDTLEISYSGADIGQAAQAIATLGADCVILDLDLGDGRPAVQNVSALHDTGVPVVILSALVDAGTVRRALEAGAIGYVSKQAQLSELLQALHSALGGQQYMSADIARALLAAPRATVQLSEREQRALVLYASGMTMGSVARRMGISEATVNEYIKRIRLKYSKAGTPVPTKVHLYQVAQTEGWLS